jgi:HEPN domain-containing protein
MKENKREAERWFLQAENDLQEAVRDLRRVVNVSRTFLIKSNVIPSDELEDTG